MPILAVSAVSGGGTDPGSGGGTDPGSGGGGSGEGPSSSTSLTLFASDGTAYDLSNRDAYLALLGRKGFDAAQYEIFADESPGIDGEVFRSARALPRDLVLPIYIRGDDRPMFLDRKRDLLSRISPARGLAVLEVAEIDGTRRRIGVYSAGRGAEGDSARDRQGRTWVKYNLELRCPDPFWRGDPMHFEFSPPTTYKFLGTTTFLPFRVSSSQSFGATAFENPGDVMSYPIWRIFGPTSGGIVLSRTTPGLPARTLALSSVLTAGQVITIDTRPDVLSITDQSGANRWPDLADGSSLWRVGPGTNLVEVSVGGAGTGTKVTLDAEPRFETV